MGDLAGTPLCVGCKSNGNNCYNHHCYDHNCCNDKCQEDDGGYDGYNDDGEGADVGDGGGDDDCYGDDCYFRHTGDAGGDDDGEASPIALLAGGAALTVVLVVAALSAGAELPAGEWRLVYLHTPGDEDADSGRGGTSDVLLNDRFTFRACDVHNACSLLDAPIDVVVHNALRASSGESIVTEETPAVLRLSGIDERGSKLRYVLSKAPEVGTLYPCIPPPTLPPSPPPAASPPPYAPLADSIFLNAITTCLEVDPVYGNCEQNPHGPISNWDVSAVLNMDFAFASQTSFNGDLMSWDTSSVTSMGDMFQRAYSFNRPISNWNTSSVTSLRYTFFGATSFTGDGVSNWDTSSVTCL